MLKAAPEKSEAKRQEDGGAESAGERKICDLSAVFGQAILHLYSGRLKLLKSCIRDEIKRPEYKKVSYLLSGKMDSNGEKNGQHNRENNGQNNMVSGKMDSNGQKNGK